MTLLPLGGRVAENTPQSDRFWPLVGRRHLLAFNSGGIAFEKMIQSCLAVTAQQNSFPRTPSSGQYESPLYVH
jgi:hypothetical protein